jgi:alpha-amylase
MHKLLLLLLISCSTYLLKAQVTESRKLALNKEVFYELNTRQFTTEGNYAGVAKHIKRLKKMGVTTVWFMPIYPIGTTNRKGSLGSYYSISNYTASNPEFGSMEQFKNLVKLIHEADMKVIIDWVANHTAWDHAWVKEHPEYYAKDSVGKMYSPFDWSDVVQLNYKNEALHTAMINEMKYWVEQTNIDGFRCDMAHLVDLNFWKKARTTLDKIKPLTWLGETQEPEYFEAFEIIYGWEFLHKMEDEAKGKCTKAQLDSIIKWYIKDYNQGKLRLLFTTNHDENSWSGTEAERMGGQAKADEYLKLCATLPGVLLIYNGQEEPLEKRLKFFDTDPIEFKTLSKAKFIKQLGKIRKKEKRMIER